MNIFGISVVFEVIGVVFDVVVDWIDLLSDRDNETNSYCDEEVEIGELFVFFVCIFLLLISVFWLGSEFNGGGEGLR